MVYQTMTDESTYAEFLHLRRVLWSYHPCRLSIGHLHYGQRMFSGWLPGSHRLSQPDGADCNIIFETWSSNSFKWSWKEKYYCILHDLLRDISLEPAVYDEHALDHDEVAVCADGNQAIRSLPLDVLTLRSQTLDERVLTYLHPIFRHLHPILIHSHPGDPIPLHHHLIQYQTCLNSLGRPETSKR